VNLVAPARVRDRRSARACIRCAQNHIAVHTGEYGFCAESRESGRHQGLLLSRLDEQQRRWYLAVESQRLGHGADRLLFEITGVGDPMSTQKWVRSSLRTLSDRLKEAGHALSPPTVGRLLRKLDYSLRVNSKQLEARSSHPDRDVQFAHIDEQIATFTAAGQPIISVDTQKKELIGDFKQAGRSWCIEPSRSTSMIFQATARGEPSCTASSTCSTTAVRLRWQLGRHARVRCRRHCAPVDRSGTGSLSHSDVVADPG